ncbi:MAG: hypothetical protein JO234_02955 [Hyphomicrobiales bacterium]|nr:hypothetical protein [Hyphomicrobiales bacterium]
MAARRHDREGRGVQGRRHDRLYRFDRGQGRHEWFGDAEAMKKVDCILADVALLGEGRRDIDRRVRDGQQLRIGGASRT